MGGEHRENMYVCMYGGDVIVGGLVRNCFRKRTRRGLGVQAPKATFLGNREEVQSSAGIVDISPPPLSYGVHHFYMQKQ